MARRRKALGVVDGGLESIDHLHQGLGPPPHLHGTVDQQRHVATAPHPPPALGGSHQLALANAHIETPVAVSARRLAEVGVLDTELPEPVAPGLSEAAIAPLQMSSRAAYPATPCQGHRSEEHTSELQSRPHLVCRLLLEKKKK